MSRREGRDSESRRHRSKFDQEPSPKRSRRDGKPETERPPANIDLDNQERSDSDQKHRRRLQDALPLEAPSEQVSNDVLTKDSEKANLEGEGKKVSSDPVDVPRSRSYFQHDERGNAGQVGRAFSRKGATDRGWWRDPKENQSERGSRTSTGDLPKKDKRARGHGEGSGTWRHDRYSEMEKDLKSLPRKRAFKEKKDPDEPEKATTVVEDSVKLNPKENLVSENDRRYERGGNTSRHAEQFNRAFGGEKEGDRGDRWRSYSSSRDRYSNRGGNFRGRDQFTSRGRHHPASTGGRVDKWKHDLYDEANKSPSPKKDEDLVAKVEALLAS
ncbi:OLC1v1002908C1 [Oldenlandia corymbosa var. corymbosa]|uniref:OLC1v1002908C1 n=1 Tax=Oldenlandia corymbosa var. corymbosa TaxID=529605 RepID=A0AAV1D8V4_OLDCO|nr:OLC1v1002908C1 [Oldenlandia corymbosa var. corymbosa]